MGAASDGGYLGSDFEAFFSAVVSGAAGVYVGVLLQDAGIETDLVVQPGQRVSVTGDPSLPRPPRWGGGSFTVQQRGSLALAGVSLGQSVSFTIEGGGSLSLASMAAPATVLRVHLSGAGSTLRLSEVTVSEATDADQLTGTMTVGADGSMAIDSATPWPDWLLPGYFTVSDGPCAVSEGGRCVGRPGGYLPRESCLINVGGNGGVLGPCSEFDTEREFDYVELPPHDRSSRHSGSDCPVGEVLASGDHLTWTSDASSEHFGWQICFVA